MVPASRSEIVIERYYALDRLRVVMIMLGTVRHASMSYDPSLIDAWPYKDGEVSVLAHWFIVFTSLFRMPIFFLIAGFFSAYLVETRGISAFIRLRWSRLGVTLLVVWPVMAALMAFTLWVAAPLSAVPPAIHLSEGAFTPHVLDYILMHLWFLYYLLILSLAAGGAQVLARRIPPEVRKRILDLFARHLRGGGLIAVILIGGIVLYQMQSWTIDYDGHPIPAPRLLALYGLLFGFGWLLFCRREALKKFTGPAWFMLAVAVPCFFVHRYFVDTGCEVDLTMRCTGSSAEYHLGAVVFLTLSMWMTVYGLIGVFLRYMNRPSPRWRYMADASYFFYLAQVPVTMLLPLVLFSLPLPGLAKLTLVVAAATGVMLLAYHYGVRSTFIGKQLNGRRYPRAAV